MRFMSLEIVFILFLLVIIATTLFFMFKAFKRKNYAGEIFGIITISLCVLAVAGLIWVYNYSINFYNDMPLQTKLLNYKIETVIALNEAEINNPQVFAQLKQEHMNEYNKAVSNYLRNSLNYASSDNRDFIRENFPFMMYNVVTNTVTFSDGTSIHYIQYEEGE